eukprot:1179727-Prorocentrum_minimum.AAC.2
MLSTAREETGDRDVIGRRDHPSRARRKAFRLAAVSLGVFVRPSENGTLTSTGSADSETAPGVVGAPCPRRRRAELSPPPARLRAWCAPLRPSARPMPSRAPGGRAAAPPTARR